MTPPRVVIATCLVALLWLPLSAQQQPARDVAVPSMPGACAIGGLVTADDRQARPVRRAVVTVTSGDTRESRSIATDERGRFVVTGLPAGRYTVSVAKAGWVTTFHGAKRAGRGPGMALALTEGQQVTDLALKLTPGAVITGRIVDQHGTPQTGVRPTLMQYRTLAGERVLGPAPSGGVAALSMVTDDRGEYRMYGLAPGTY